MDFFASGAATGVSGTQVMNSWQHLFTRTGMISKTELG
jgi:hypothetical protein